MSSRRSFIKKGALTASIPIFAPNTELFSILKGAPSDQLNIGVIGTGGRGQGLINIINRIEGIELIAICDTLPFRLSEAASLAPKAKQFSNHQEMLLLKNLDAVIISTPLSTHAAIASDAVDASVHIYCEKTMVKGDQDTLDLIQKVENNHKKVFQTGHQYHSSRLYSHVVEMIQAGDIGQVIAINAQWNRNGNWRRHVPNPKLERQINWRMYREYSYGLTAELSSHQIDFCNWLLQDNPKKVAGFGGIDYWKDGRETYDNTNLIYSYSNGVKASFTCLTSNAKDDYQIKVMGDKATVIINYDKAWKYPEGKYNKVMGDVDGVSGATQSWTEGKGNLINFNHLEPTRQALEDFKSSIINNTIPLSNLKSGAAVSFAVDMGIRAMDLKQVVSWNPKYDL
ncbi:Gfo/Idh/MocA family oxidoreductase [Flavobacteriaceae bacterium]|nr:Gfo/Idh/MocA family oxidoreductase [Flavobacteriaceae bacterium]MDC1459908.1 Gfo/Idh/MocA family oxidoreductase [Flavobacteriaceae bacterium]MDC3221247.1 Gfo/Idh/MocA family oxidoreductase [Flavobacteriaceae bacterium]